MEERVLADKTVRSVEARIYEDYTEDITKRDDAIDVGENLSFAEIQTIFEGYGNLTNEITSNNYASLAPPEYDAIDIMYNSESDVTDIRCKFVDVDTKLRCLEEMIYNTEPASLPERTLFFKHFGVKEDEAAEMISHLRSSLTIAQEHPIYKALYENDPLPPAENKYFTEIRSLFDIIKTQNPLTLQENEKDANNNYQQLKKVEQRIHKVEQAVGNLLNQEVSVGHDFSDICSAITDIAVRIIIIEEERGDVFKQRMQVIAQSLDRITEAAQTVPCDKARFLSMASEIEYLFDLSTRARLNNGLLSQVVHRLKDLRAVHINRNTMQNDIDRMELSVKELREKVDSLQFLSDKIDGKVNGAIENLSASM